MKRIILPAVAATAIVFRPCGEAEVKDEPTTDNLIIIKEISILDLNQKIVYNKLNPEKGTIELNISNIDSGIYFVLIESDRDKIVKKFIKE